MKPIFKLRGRPGSSKICFFIVALGISVAAFFWNVNLELPLASFSEDVGDSNAKSGEATTSIVTETPHVPVQLDPEVTPYVPVRPDQCTEAQKQEISRQYDGRKMRLSWYTSCPMNTWWQEYYLNDEDPAGGSRISVSLGCNKGVEAVESLARISRDASVDIHKWTHAGGWVERTVCKPPRPRDVLPIRTRNESVPTRLYCVEAVPSTAKQLRERVVQLGLQGKMYALNYAMGDTNGVVQFPNVSSGEEGMGMHDCQRNASLCADVPQITLDALRAEHIPDDAFIDILTVDTEGNDWPVLSTGRGALNRTRYLEFEHHEIGAWKKHDLKDVVEDLSTNHGFICYYAGKGKLWRLTDCWIDFYNTKTWSNVACVNSRDPTMAPLAKRMEDLFLRTIATSTTS